MILQEFFQKFIHLEDLEELLMRHGLATDGSEDEMIVRLLAEPSFYLDEISTVLHWEDLQNICRALRLPVSYKKDELWEMIKDQLGLSHDWDEDLAPPQEEDQEDKTIPWWRDLISKITIRVVAGVISGLILAVLLLILGLS